MKAGWNFGVDDAFNSPAASSHRTDKKIPGSDCKPAPASHLHYSTEKRIEGNCKNYASENLRWDKPGLNIFASWISHVPLERLSSVGSSPLQRIGYPTCYHVCNGVNNDDSTSKERESLHRHVLDLEQTWSLLLADIRLLEDAFSLGSSPRCVPRFFVCVWVGWCGRPDLNACFVCAHQETRAQMVAPLPVLLFGEVGSQCLSI